MRMNGKERGDKGRALIPTLIFVANVAYTVSHITEDRHCDTIGILQHFL